MSANDDQPAFPEPGLSRLSDDQFLLGRRGMTLLEWYIGQALSNPALCTGLAEERDIIRWFGKDACGITRAEIAAKQAEEIAQAIMFQRGSRPA